MAMRFAGFIMTYERADSLKETIDEIFAQSLSPEKLLIIDNSTSNNTKELIDLLQDHRLQYHRVGYNAGPAGAARIGLQQLSDEGYDWIYWGDDDDPPHLQNTFLDLLTAAVESSNIGIVGAVGQHFDKNTGNIIRVKNSLLEQQGLTDVDVVAGGQTMIVSAEVVKRGILPDPDLFFGFEELDFCIAVKKAGFRIVVNNNLFWKLRMKWGRTGFIKKQYIKKSNRALSKEYYSTRNLLFIAKKNGYAIMKYKLLMKFLLKVIYGYRYGVQYGYANSKYILKGLLDYFNNKTGKLEA
jgi:GT2 family glycosyltransferase